MGGKVWNPLIRWTTKYAVFVVLEDENANFGTGECWCFDSSPETLVAFLKTEVVPNFIGIELDECEEVCKRLLERATLTARHGILTSALSGVDIAAWDLRSQQQDVPLWKCIDPNGRGTVPLYGSGGLYGHEKGIPELVAEVNSMVSKGFQLVKMKVGALDLKEDLLRVQAVLEALPETSKLIIDGLYGLSVDRAREFYELLPEGRIEAFQSPIRASDLKGMAQLSKAGVPVMAIESEYRIEIQEILVNDCGIAFLQTAPIASGGISAMNHLCELTNNTPTRLSLEISSTAIALLVSSHIAAAINQIAHVEYHYVHQVFFNELDFRKVPGSINCFSFPDRNGLGMSLNHLEVKTEFEQVASSQSPCPPQAVHWLNH